MNGPDHYREAERLIEEGQRTVARIAAVDERDRRDDFGKKAMGIWAQAQVHATLAQTAAIALGVITAEGFDPDETHAGDEWERTLRAATPTPAMPQLSPAWPAEPIRMWDHNWCQTTDPARARYITVDRPEGTRAVLDVAQEVK